MKYGAEEGGRGGERQIKFDSTEMKRLKDSYLEMLLFLFHRRPKTRNLSALDLFSYDNFFWSSLRIKDKLNIFIIVGPFKKSFS